jgi:hypothetical protein
VSDDDHLDNPDAAFLLRMSTLWPVDKAFAMLRRRVAMVERPVSSVRRARRSWQIYAAYDPRMIGLMLEIFRVWHNWLWRSPRDGKTAAERLGLAEGQAERITYSATTFVLPWRGSGRRGRRCTVPSARPAWLTGR